MNPQDTSFGKYKYEKGKIYKLCCKDPNITEIYIGSTLNQYRRKHEHKGTCNNPNNRRYNLYVYQFIRENGGFENWDLVILEEYPTENKNELTWKEREYIELLQPALNCVKRPVVTAEENLEKCRERARKYREENLEKYRERGRKWYEENTEKFSGYAKKYYENNKEQLCEYYRRYRENNKEKICEKKRRYREENPEKCRENERRYRENNPEKCREKDRRYYENNKEKCSEAHKKWRENKKEKISEKRRENKEKINEKGRERVNCDICNKELARGSLTRHKKTFHST